MSEPTKLVVVWSSADRDVALHPCFMYTHNSLKHGWWEEVRLVIWGPSNELVRDDEEIRGKLKAMMETGVEVMACRYCADVFGVTEMLEELGVKVIYMGQPLTQMIKEGWASLTY